MDEMNLPILIDGEDKSDPFKNRVRKNYQHLRKWAKRSNTNCFRIYDRDIKEYPLAIDFYAGRFCVHYFSDREEEADASNRDAEKTHQLLQELFGVGREAIYERERIRRKKIEQYEKVGEEKQFFTVLEYGVQFKVNLVDYLDTGLFLDHRETRQMVARLCKNKRLLNLFAYTSSFSVQAAFHGAAFTKSVDMSNTYCAWGRENFLLNALNLKKNEIIREDCLYFLQKERELYDIIVVDPPTLSRSKKMEQLFDIQVDYIPLLHLALPLLSPGGTLFFSTNSRKFLFDKEPFAGYEIRDISEKTLPLDFHNKKIHRCWQICAG